MSDFNKIKKGTILWDEDYGILIVLKVKFNEPCAAIHFFSSCDKRFYEIDFPYNLFKRGITKILK